LSFSKVEVEGRSVITYIELLRFSYPDLAFVFQICVVPLSIITLRKMKKLLLIFLLILPSSFAMGAECYRQRNPIGYTNYDICEVAGTGYICVSLEGKSDTISCFPSPRYHESSAPKKEIIRRKTDGEETFYNDY